MPIKRPSDFTRGLFVTDSKTGQLAEILHVEDSRYTAKIMYSLKYISNGKRIRCGFYRLAGRFVPNEAATILYGK